MSRMVSFSHRDAASWDDPWPMYAALRDHDPVHHVGDGDFWVLTRHDHVFAAARDAETFSSAAGLTTEYDELERIGLVDNPPFVMTDPPTHTAFRRLVSRGFTPRQVEAIEPSVRSFVVERLERLWRDGGGDIVADLFKPLPSMVVAHYLGVPEEDRDRFDGWTDAIVGATGSADGAASAGSAALELMAYFTDLIDRRRRDPGDDTISHLVMAGEGDDDAGLMRVLAFTFTMVAGGNDTTTGLLGSGVQLLADRPDQRRLVLQNVDSSVEELLRLTSPVQGLARTTVRDVEFDGVRIPAGRKVLLSYAAANRDPRMYGPDADELDVTRNPRQVLSFSHGAAPLSGRCRGADDGARDPHRAPAARAGLHGRSGVDPMGTRQLCATPPQHDHRAGPMSWLADDRTALAADRILDAAASPVRRARRHRRRHGPGREGGGLLAGNAVPLLRQPTGVDDCVRAPRGP